MLTEPEVMALIDAVLRLRLLQQVELNPHRPLVQLTPRGEQVMRAEMELSDLVPLDPLIAAKLRSLAPRARPAAERLAAERPAPENHDEPTTKAAGLAAADRSATPHFWTWRVLSAGISADECRQIRGLDADTLYDHVLRAGREGQPVEAAWLLSGQQIATLDTLIGTRPLSEIRALAAHLPPGIKFRDVQLYLLSKNQTTEEPKNRNH
jgi:hypothetical protein